MCLETWTQRAEIAPIPSKSAQKGERGMVTELKKQTLPDFVGQKIEDFYNPLSDIVLIKVLTLQIKEN